MSNSYRVDERGVLNNFAVEPKMYVDDTDKAGFTTYAELLNGRLAMIGFASLLILEAATSHGLIWWLGNL